MSEETPPLLRVESLASGYGQVGVLENVSFSVAPGTICAVIGSNGAGKSTLLRTISGLLQPMGGHITFDGKDIGGISPRQIVAAGILHVAEGRRLFRKQSVADNLELGLFNAGLSRQEERRRFEQVYGYFPVLRERRDELAGSLSGGQQQMLAIGQALMRSPRLLMLDEPSLGLAPVIVDQVFDLVIRLCQSGCTIILVEQLVERALDIAHSACVLRNGTVTGSGPVAELRRRGIIDQAYFTA